jgi:hypothetical protein
MTLRPEPMPDLRRPTYAVAVHTTHPPAGDLVDAVVPDGPGDDLDDLVVVAISAWARTSARRAGCRCEAWLHSRACRTDPYEIVVECWGHSPGCPAGPDTEGRTRWAVCKL